LFVGDTILRPGMGCGPATAGVGRGADTIDVAVVDVIGAGRPNDGGATGVSAAFDTFDNTGNGGLRLVLDG